MLRLGAYGPCRQAGMSLKSLDEIATFWWFLPLTNCCNLRCRGWNLIPNLSCFVVDKKVWRGSGDGFFPLKKVVRWNSDSPRIPDSHFSSFFDGMGNLGVATNRWSFADSRGAKLESQKSPFCCKDSPVTCPERSRYVRTPAMCFDGIIVTVSVAQAPSNGGQLGVNLLISGIRNRPFNAWPHNEFSCNDCKSSNWNNHLSTFVDVSWCFWLPGHHRSLTHLWTTFYEEHVFHINSQATVPWLWSGREFRYAVK